MRANDEAVERMFEVHVGFTIYTRVCLSEGDLNLRI